MGVTRIWLVLAATLLLASAMAGCSSPGNQAQPASTTQPAPADSTAGAQQNGAYPGPAAQAYPAPGLPAYPGPGQELVPTEAPPGRQPEPVPTPASGLAVVHGRIYDIATDQPIYDGVLVYLSKVVATNSTDMDAVSLDRENDPNVVPDIEGGFAIADVPPGRYGIVVQGPLNQYMTRFGDNRNKDVIIVVEAGQTLDLGKIYAGYP